MNKKFFVLSVVMAVLAVFALSEFAHAVQYIQMKPLEQVIKIGTGSVTPGKKDKLPLITWGGDEATILANGMGIVLRI